MATITIALPDDRLQQLKETATQLKVSPEELVRISIEELLTRPEDAFQRVRPTTFSRKMLTCTSDCRNAVPNPQ